MVFYFTCSDDRYIVYMGEDKYENRELLTYAFPEDVWFHVEHLSSAHVYIRMPLGETSHESIPQTVITEVAQLTKANSIEGSKSSTVDVIYTMSSNLKQTPDMAVGQVSAIREAEVVHLKHISRDRVLLKQLEKTKREEHPKLHELREDRDAEMLRRKKKAAREQRIKERDDELKREEEEKAKNYDWLQAANQTEEHKGDGTINSCKAIEEDFM